MSQVKANPRMVEVVSLRNFRLETTKGYIEQFEAKVPKKIPEAILPEAMQAGIMPTDADDQPFYEDLSRAKVEFTGDIRRSMVYLAVSAIMKSNDTKDFDAGGYPKTAAVANMLGFEVARQDVIDLFQAHQQAQASGNEFALHPASANILRVLEAGNKAELVELADEFGVDKSKAQGLTVKDLRKLLLVKLDGTAVGG